MNYDPVTEKSKQKMLVRQWLWRYHQIPWHGQNIVIGPVALSAVLDNNTGRYGVWRY